MFIYARQDAFGMSRTMLAPLLGERLVFIGTFERYGTKSGWEGRVLQTMLLKNIHVAGLPQVLTDHVWFTVGKRLGATTFGAGDQIQFKATVEEYEKGYVNDREFIDESEIDYKLSRPNNIVKI